MTIESTGLQTEFTQNRVISNETERPREVAAREADEVASAEEGRDRFDPSPVAPRRRFVSRFKRLAQDAFERPDEKDGIADELKDRFKDALRALKKLGVLDKQEFKALRKAFRYALDAIESTGTQAAELSRETSVQQSRSISLDVETVEGDTVQIRLEKQRSVDESVEVRSDGDDGIEFAGERTVANRSFLGFTVVGDLNEDEREAIGDLVVRVDQLAQRFFEGDVQAAFVYAQEFGLPDEEIASFSVELGYSLEARAITAYREVEALAAPAEDAEDVSAVDDLLDDVRTLAESARLQLLFVDSRQLVLDFFRGALEIGAFEDDAA